MKDKIAVFVIAYEAEKTIFNLLNRIPFSVWEMSEEVFVIDDASDDKTFELAKKFKPPEGTKAKFVVMKNGTNQGYGGNQKCGYNYAIKNGFDIVVLLHGDLQYPPESIPDLIKPILDGTADMSYGSRMLENPIAGGMPFWRYNGNKFLTLIENIFLNNNLSEYHSGFRAYSAITLKSLPITLNSNKYLFDTEIIIQFKVNNLKIAEIPIPTHYGPESRNISFSKSVWYGFGILKQLLLFLLHKNNIYTFDKFRICDVQYAFKDDPYSSHTKIIELVPENSNVIDFGCAQGYLGEQLVKNKKCFVVGVDKDKQAVKKASKILNKVYLIDINNINWKLNEKADIVLCADILEHLIHPDKFLDKISSTINDNGKLIISVPNIANIYVRLSLLFGKFQYSDKGILDRTHLHFYTKKSIIELLKKYNLEVIDVKTTPIPLPLVWDRFNSFPFKIIHAINNYFTRIFKNLLAYQFIITCKKK